MTSKQQKRGQQWKSLCRRRNNNEHFPARLCHILPLLSRIPSLQILIFIIISIISLPASIFAIQIPSSGFNNNNDANNNINNNNKQQRQQQPTNEQKIRAVSTPFGIIRGQLVYPNVYIADAALPPVVQYLSIPYGSAPTGQHRFKMAISAPKWTHQPKDATHLTSTCIQSGLSALSTSEALKVTTSQRFDRLHRILPFLRPQSEDCLFMNLFVPERRELRDAQPLSVLVLVHGDTDYSWGGANAYNGTLLASLGRIVVVTLNYRLGVYGFLGRCDPEAMHSCAGNAGLSDLVAALKMLSLLLPSFGGDANAVTLLGWESGAALVSLLMTSPITQPKGRLFRRAILLDGSALAPWAMANNPQEQFMRLAEELKCLKNSGVDSNPASQSVVFLDSSTKEGAARILYCLQNHSTQNLSAAARRVANVSPTFLSAFAPIIDGQMVPNQPKNSFSPKFGALFREIDLLIGTVVHPAQHLLSDQDMQHGLTTDRRDKILRTLVRNIFDFHRSEIFQAILNEYTDWENPKNHPKSTRNGLMAALSDILFTAPMVETARAHSLNDMPLKPANTFFFVFAHESIGWMRDQPNSGLRGSFTGDHLPYILGYPFTVDMEEEQMNGGSEGAENGVKMQFSPEDKQLCRVMMTYVANFVKSGDPSRPQPMFAQSNIEDRFQGLPWPQFSSQTREAYLEITDRPRVKNYYRNSFVQFWSSFVPVLNRRGGKDVPEEHHLLPDHFDRSTFFGQPSPHSTYHNIPFPPPPMPPTPFPKELRKQLIIALTTKRPPGASGEFAMATPASSVLNLQQQQSSNDAGNGSPHSRMAEYNPSWGWLIFGVTLTGINLCILVAIISKKCIQKRSESQKKFHYQSYATPASHMAPSSALDMNFPTTLLPGGQQSRVPITARRYSSQYTQAPTSNNNTNTINNNFHRHEEIHRHSMFNSVPQLPFNQLHQQQFVDKLLDTDSSAVIGIGGGATPGGLPMNRQHQLRHSFSKLQQNNIETTTANNRKMTIDTFNNNNVGIHAASVDEQQKFQQNYNKNDDEGNSMHAKANQAMEVTSMPGCNSFSLNSSSFQQQQKNQNGKCETSSYGSRLNRLQLLNSSNNNNKIFGLEQHTTDVQQQQQRRHTIISKPMLLQTKQNCQQQQEPLLSATGSLKGSTPSVVIQQPSAGGPSLIRMNTGISPTCPRHGRAAQMMLAAAAANRATSFGGCASGGTKAPQYGMTINTNNDAATSGSGIPGTETTITTSMGGQQQQSKREQQQQQQSASSATTLEEVQV